MGGVNQMTLWIGKNSVYSKAKSLKDYEARLRRTSADKSFRVQVFKSIKTLMEGLDYTNYDWNGENLKKSNAQPAVEINQLLSQLPD